MRILSFNASNPNLHACLWDSDKVIAEQIIICDAVTNLSNKPSLDKSSLDKPSPGKASKSREFAASLIIPTVADLLKKTGWQKSNIEAIAVGIGPGSFTGIRVAVVTARTLAQALSLPLLGINEFECYAFREQIMQFPAAILLSAGKSQYYCAHIDNSLLSDIEATLNNHQINWDMTTHHLAEQDLQSHLAQFKKVLTPPTTDQAVIQATLTNYRLAQAVESKQCLIEIFPYQLVKPLYIRNASITMSSTDR